MKPSKLCLLWLGERSDYMVRVIVAARQLEVASRFISSKNARIKCDN